MRLIKIAFEAAIIESQFGMGSRSCDPDWLHVFPVVSAQALERKGADDLGAFGRTNSESSTADTALLNEAV